MHACERVKSALLQDAHLAAGVKSLVDSFRVERAASGDK
jgi:hypothetical protein